MKMFEILTFHPNLGQEKNLKFKNSHRMISFPALAFDEACPLSLLLFVNMTTVMSDNYCFMIDLLQLANVGDLGLS